MSEFTFDPADIDLSDCDVPSPLLRGILDQPNSNEEILLTFDSFTSSSNTNDRNSLDFSNGFNSNSNNQDILTENAAMLSDIQYTNDCMSIIAQPTYTFRLRTRDEHTKDKRHDTLTAKEPNSNFTGPTICILPSYMNTDEQFYIGIFLVTVFHKNSQCRYFHPYELDDFERTIRNSADNSLWYPINKGSSINIQSFPNICILKQTQQYIKTNENLKPFYGYTLNSNLFSSAVPKSISGRKLTKDYDLKKSQLAFTIGKKRDLESEFPVILDDCIFVYSDEMIEINEKDKPKNNKNVESTAASQPLPSIQQITRYIPSYGDADGNENMVIFLPKERKKLKLADLQIRFEFNEYPFANLTSYIVDKSTVEIEDQAILFKTPPFPVRISSRVVIKIIVQKGKKIFDPIDYEYRSKYEYSSTSSTNRNKRSKYSLVAQSDDTDAVVPIVGTKPVLQQCKSEPECYSSNASPQSLVNNGRTNISTDKIIDKLEESVRSLFIDNDYTMFLRLCRSFIRQKPHLLHQAIDNNHSDLLTKFIPGTNLNLFYPKNHLGESVLLHAVRLNRLSVVKALLERQNSDKLVNDVTNDGQNILHIVAKNKDSKEMLDVLIDYFDKEAIDIKGRFDKVDNNDNTPLQLAIINNNLSATQVLLKFANKTVCNRNGDDLIQLATRYGDSQLCECLLVDEDLKKQTNETNSKLPPIESAQPTERDGTVEHLNKLYTKLEIRTGENSDE
ncbi:hypothetical protein I4U23_026143 [Adineta vaga]|nr:hypothetical protein I4U23_026143 [Adineta vaga]